MLKGKIILPTRHTLTESTKSTIDLPDLPDLKKYTAV